MLGAAALLAVPGGQPEAAPLAGAGAVAVEAGPVTVESPPSLLPEAERLAADVPILLARLERRLGGRPRGRFRIVLLPPPPHRNPRDRALDARAPGWAAGFLLPAERLGAIRVSAAGRYPHGSLRVVLAHEMAHQVLHDLAGGALPRWFEEGAAVWAAREHGWQDSLTLASSLLTAVPRSPTAIDRGFASSPQDARAAYAAAFDLVSWLVSRVGDDAVRRIVAAAPAASFEAAWKMAAGESLSDSFAGWRRRSALRYRWLPLLTGTSALWAGIVLLAMLARMRRRARARAIARRWEIEEGPEEKEETLH